MTIHVLHAGDGYLYLLRTVAAHDGRLTPGESLASYYVASGQPPGRWGGRSAERLSVAGVVTEAQMKSLFGEGLHPNAVQIEARLKAVGATSQAVRQATALGRRFPRYGHRRDVVALARAAYVEEEKRLGRALTDVERLNVRGKAAQEEFVRRHGREPLDPVELETMGESKSQEAVAGYDFVFTPVKSVAVLWGIASAEVRQQIFEAHEVATVDAIEWLESHAALTRTGDRGQAQINTQGVIAAKFHHWDSRAGDPDLHTHVAVSNKVQGPDGKWRSLDGRALFAAAVSLSERYNTRIEDELRLRLGVEFTERADTADGLRAVREIEGVPRALIDGFSKRRVNIERRYDDLVRDYRRDHSHEPSPSTRHQLYQQAALYARPDKTGHRSLQQMVRTWRTEADVLLGAVDVAADVERRAISLHRIQEAPEPNELVENVLATLSSSRSTWNEHHVRAEAHRQSRSFTTHERDELVESIVRTAMSPARSVRIETPRTIGEPGELQRSDGESVFVEHGSTLFTTNVILDAEHRIVEAARRRESYRLTVAEVADALARAATEGPALNAGQEAMARAFCISGRGVQLGLAPAGSGKTTAMRVVSRAWTQSGHQVVALAPSAVAADVLATELSVEADTLAKFDHDNARIARDTLILVDEAGMAGTLLLDRLITRAHAAHAVVRLIGDDQQLGAIEAGGVIRQIAHDVGAVRMEEVLRFSDPDEAAATVAVRNGAEHAAAFYFDHDRVVAGTSVTAPEAAYAGWLCDVRAGRDSLLLTASSSEASALNAQARADLIADGRVKVDGLKLRDGNAAAVGDHVATRRNERRLAVHGGRDWVKNGDGWRVLAVHEDGAMTVQHRTHRGVATLRSEYVRAHVELDYARTIRRAQGITVDHAHLLVDPRLAREDLYVGLSRARHGTHLYVAVMEDPGPDHQPEVAGSAQDVLRAIIARTAIESSATEAIRTALTSADDIRRMAVEYEHALTVCVGDRYRRTAETYLPGVTRDPSWPSVARRLHLGEGLGLSPADLLREVDEVGGFEDARSMTQVLAFRLDRILERATERSTVAPVPSWLGALPPTTSVDPWTTYLQARYEEMAERITGLATSASQDCPPWIAGIGDGLGRLEAIRQVVTYRTVYTLTCDDAIGLEPDQRTRQHEAWSAVTRAVNISHSEDRPPSGADRLRDELALRNEALDDRVATEVRSSPIRHV